MFFQPVDVLPCEHAGGLPEALLADAAHTLRGWPEYRATPLLGMPGLARALGLGQVWVKDESARFGKGGVKALGAPYALQRLLRTHGGGEDWCAVAATDGNHGLALAWAARRLGGRARIFVGQGVDALRVQRIRDEGAEVVAVAGTYDDAVHAAAHAAGAPGCLLVSDTDDTPGDAVVERIMAGYALLGSELASQLDDRLAIIDPALEHAVSVRPELVEGRCRDWASTGSARTVGSDFKGRVNNNPLAGPGSGEGPTHFFLQCGVGGVAAGVLSGLFAASTYRPRVITVEPERAACVRDSLCTGRLVSVPGGLETRMVGLSCGRPSASAFALLRRWASAALTVPEATAAQLQAQLSAGAFGDAPLATGDTGVAGLAGLWQAASDRQLREALGLDACSRVLAINSEGPLCA
ncbi:MAG: pyridoxal-phosphate dependent enzyme [Rhodocyclaceae bacterium]